MPEIVDNFPSPAHLPERRRHMRVPITSASYLELGTGNSGLILNISQGGLALQAAERVAEAAFSKMRFQLPNQPMMLEVAGNLIWQGASHKRVGIQFVNLPAEVRQQIHNWILSELSGGVSANTDTSVPARDDSSGSDVAPTFSEFAAMFPSEKTLNPSVTPQVPRRAAILSREIKEAVGGWRAPFDSSPLPSVTARSSEAEPTSSSDAPSYGAGRPRPLDEADIHRIPTDRIQKSATSQTAFRSLGDLATSPLKAAPGAPPLDEIAGRAFYEELMASHATDTNSNSLHPIRSGLLPAPHKGAPTAAAADPGTIILPGFGYQPPAFEEPSGKEWLWVSAVLTGILIVGAVMAIGPANVNTLALRYIRSSNSDRMSMRATTGATAPAPQSDPPSNGSEASAVMQPVPLPETRIEAFVPAAGAAITESQRKESAQKSFSADQEGDDLSVAEDTEALTQQFKQQHVQTKGSNDVAHPAGGDGGPSSGPLAAPPASLPALATSQPPTQPAPRPTQSPSDSGSPPPSPVSQALAAPSGTVAILSHFHSLWGSEAPPSPADGPLVIGQVESMHQPIYPVEAERARIEGTIVLRAIVDRTGAIEIVQLIGGPPILAPAAISAVRDWKYAPTYLNGRPVESVEDISVVFRLANAGAIPR